MKLPILKWVSVAIVLPLITTTLNPATPAGAEQIDRSRSRVSGSGSPSLDLNLSIPTDNNLDVDSTAPANPKRRSLTAVNSTLTSSTVESSSKPKSIRRRKDSATNLSAASSTVEPSSKHKSIRRRKDLATNLDPNPPIATDPNSTSSTVEQSKYVHRQQYPVTNFDTPPPPTDNGRRMRRKIAAVSQPPLSGNYLRLVRDPNKGTNDNGNPIYTLEAYIGGERYQKFNAVSGIASSQNLDRNRGMNHAPLPDGLYHVSDRIVPGAVPEVGRTFVGIYPQFDTNRSDLGIHLDPSFNQRNGSDGTSGCIGLTTAADRDALNEFVLKYHPRNLYVSIVFNRDRE